MADEINWHSLTQQLINMGLKTQGILWILHFQIFYNASCRICLILRSTYSLLEKAAILRK